nr:hypothetical protein [Pandoravirus massiliensis]
MELELANKIKKKAREIWVRPRAVCEFVSVRAVNPPVTPGSDVAFMLLPQKRAVFVVFVWKFQPHPTAIGHMDKCGQLGRAGVGHVELNTQDTRVPLSHLRVTLSLTHIWSSMLRSPNPQRGQKKVIEKPMTVAKVSAAASLSAWNMTCLSTVDTPRRLFV